jgi:four helix bundle protein
MSKPAATFHDLLVWQKSHAIVLDIYAITAIFPKQEMFGLASQMRRAAVSVPSNIAEGFRRRSRLDKARFLNVAAASLDELQYQLLLAHDLGYCDSRRIQAAAVEVARMLSSYEGTILLSARMSNLRNVAFFLTSVSYLLYSVP